jgi:5-amino-6-(5-phosphoribosylamino)uracil reductase
VPIERRQERFDEFVVRKQQEAVRAVLPPFVTEEERVDPGMLAIGSPWSKALFDGDFYVSPSVDSARPGCNLVFVQSKDGNTGAKDPSTLGGGETDKHLIYEGLSRVAADAVLAGAETIRGGAIVLSVWHPELVRLRESIGKPRHPVQIVATLQGLDIEYGILFNTPEIRVVLITVGSCARLMDEQVAARPWITPLVMSAPGDLPYAFERLREMGVAQVSAIGGRRIATQLIDMGLVQDVYLTTSWRPGGEPDTPMYPKPLNGAVMVRKRGTGRESGVTFEHVRLDAT